MVVFVAVCIVVLIVAVLAILGTGYMMSVVSHIDEWNED